MVRKWLNDNAPQWLNQPGDAFYILMTVLGIYLCVRSVTNTHRLVKENRDQHDVYAEDDWEVPKVVYVFAAIDATLLVYFVVSLVRFLANH